MTPFDISGKEAFSKHCGKRRKCWLPAFSPFPTLFSTLSKIEIIIYVTIILLSANAFNLDKVKSLSSGNGLNVSLIMAYMISQIFSLFLQRFSALLPHQIKALKTLVWHLSRKPMKEMSSLKK